MCLCVCVSLSLSLSIYLSPCLSLFLCLSSRFFYFFFFVTFYLSFRNLVSHLLLSAVMLSSSSSSFTPSVSGFTSNSLRGACQLFVRFIINNKLYLLDSFLSPNFSNLYYVIFHHNTQLLVQQMPVCLYCPCSLINVLSG